jgi:hypothetical protein
MITKSKCGCTGDILCDTAKKLWNRSSFKDRKLYSDHRCIALGLEPRYHSFRATNRDNDTGKKIKFKSS